ncbi:UBC-like protein [Cubamyces lactineus]|nr:UBC-like protein [Cubamyces lactineus]
MAVSSRRLQKELMEMKKEGTPAGITLLQADDFAKWILSVEVLGDSLYKDEKFAIMFRFDNQYPISAPAVQFVVDDKYQAPIHPHVYSNGHICASILGNEWSPVLSVVAVCVTIQSMLASCKRVAPDRPPDNDRYVARAPDNPKKVCSQYFWAPCWACS